MRQIVDDEFKLIHYIKITIHHHQPDAHHVNLIKQAIGDNTFLSTDCDTSPHYMYHIRILTAHIDKNRVQEALRACFEDQFEITWKELIYEFFDGFEYTIDADFWKEQKLARENAQKLINGDK